MGRSGLTADSGGFPKTTVRYPELLTEESRRRFSDYSLRVRKYWSSAKRRGNLVRPLNGDKPGSIRLHGVAEGVGFEPTVACATTVFKTVTIGRSVTPPRLWLGSLRRYPAAVREREQQNSSGFEHSIFGHALQDMQILQGNKWRPNDPTRCRRRYMSDVVSFVKGTTR